MDNENDYQKLNRIDGVYHYSWFDKLVGVGLGTKMAKNNLDTKKKKKKMRNDPNKWRRSTTKFHRPVVAFRFPTPPPPHPLTQLHDESKTSQVLVFLPSI